MPLPVLITCTRNQRAATAPSSEPLVAPPFAALNAIVPISLNACGSVAAAICSCAVVPEARFAVAAISRMFATAGNSKTSSGVTVTGPAMVYAWPMASDCAADVVTPGVQLRTNVPRSRRRRFGISVA